MWIPSMTNDECRMKDPTSMDDPSPLDPRPSTLGTSGPTPLDTRHSTLEPSWLFASSTLGGSFRVYLPATVAVRALGMGRMLAFAWLILKTEYGLQQLAFQLINLLSAVTRLGVPVALERYAPSHERTGQLVHFVRRGLWIASLITAALTLLLAALAPWLANLAFTGRAGQLRPADPDYGPLLQLTFACLGVMLVLTVFLSLQGVLRGLRMYRALAVMEVIHGVSFLAFGVGGLLLAGVVRFSHFPTFDRLAGAAVVLTLAYGFSLVVASGWIGLLFARHLGRWTAQHGPMPGSRRALAARLLRFSGYLTGPNVLWQVFLIFGLWYVNTRHGESEAGLFAVTRNLMQAVQLLALAVWPTAQNAAAHLWERGPEHRPAAVYQIGQVFRLSGWPLWVLSAAVVLCRPAIEMLLPATYAGASAVLPWMLVMFMWMIHLSLPTAHAYLLENSKAVLAAAAVGLAVHAASAWWLVGAGKSIGAAQSASAGAAAAVIVLLWLVARASREYRWIAGRDAPLLAAPLLLAAPSAWPAGGDYLLLAATLAVVALLAVTNVLWSREDRRTFWGYLSHSVSLLVGRAKPPG